MMGGFGMFTMMFWMVLGTLLFIVLATVVIWFLVRWLNRQKAPMMPYTPRQDSLALLLCSLGPTCSMSRKREREIWHRYACWYSAQGRFLLSLQVRFGERQPSWKSWRLSM